MMVDATKLKNRRRGFKKKTQKLGIFKQLPCLSLRNRLETTLLKSNKADNTLADTVRDEKITKTFITKRTE